VNVLDLFSGIGGFSLGLERAGLRTVAFCEIEPYCRAVLRKHWPGVPVYDDVRALTAERLSADGIGPIDVICGGFPCQDISIAGKGAGLEGRRSGLWGEFRRLIEEVRPQFALIENVSALRSRGLDRVLGETAALGYDAEWHCIPASAVGAPHRRDRIWIVAYAHTGLHTRGLDFRGDPRAASGGEGEDAGARQASHWERLRPQSGAGGEVVADTDGQREPQSQGVDRYKWRRVGDGGEKVAHPNIDSRQPCRAGDAGEGPRGRDAGGGGVGSYVADTARQLLDGGGLARQRRRPRLTDGGWWESEPNVGRVAYGIPSRVDRLSALGNAVVPQIPEILGRMIQVLA
jgi:DNA (cytosine-5)-methyltransferase 1